MDGTISLFPLSDYSAIFAKQWKSDGLIHSVKFVPAQIEEQKQEKSFNETVLERLDKIEKMLTPNVKKTVRKDETDGEQGREDRRADRDEQRSESGSFSAGPERVLG